MTTPSIDDNIDDVLLDIADIVKDTNIDTKFYNIIIEVFNSISFKQITTENVSSYIIYLMKILDTYNNIKGKDKKVIVTLILKKIVQFTVVDPNEASILDTFIDNVLPPLIDTLILLDNKEIVIKTENYVKSSWHKFFLFLTCANYTS